MGDWANVHDKADKWDSANEHDIHDRHADTGTMTHNKNPFIHDGEEEEHAKDMIKSKINKKKAKANALRKDLDEDAEVSAVKAEKVAAVKEIAKKEIADAEAAGDYKAAKKARKEAKKALEAEDAEDDESAKLSKKSAEKKEAAEVAAEAAAAAAKAAGKKKFQAGNKAAAKEKAIKKIEKL